MTDTRKKDFNWQIATNEDGTTPAADARLAVMMDIRDELKRLNALLHCHRFMDIPDTLRRIDRRLAKHLPLRGKR